MNLQETFGLSERYENEPNIKPPIIDIFRHAETWYKELTDPNFELDPDDPNFVLDADHLDLTAEGIENIRQMAEQLAARINRENEVVILVASPQLRARSSIFIIEQVFLEHGIIMLNSTAQYKFGLSKGIKTSKFGLGQIPMNKDAEDNGLTKLWIEKHGQYVKDHPEVKNLPPAELHKLVADHMGIELSDIFAKNHTDIDRSFRDYIRHLANIERYLSDEVKQLLKGRQLRIISVTHEERLASFASETLGVDQTVPKGNLLEIVPAGSISKDGAVNADVKLFGRGVAPALSKLVSLRFSEQDLIVDSTGCSQE